MPDATAIPVIDLGPCLADEPGALDRAAAIRYQACTYRVFGEQAKDAAE
jgi:hypothetical protein